MRTNGVILVDNVLWGGRVLDESAADDDTKALRAFNDMVQADPRVDSVILTIGDGLRIIRKR
jgi:caffeoyl-CoA O-methyltransferase